MEGEGLSLCGLELLRLRPHNCGEFEEARGSSSWGFEGLIALANTLDEAFAYYRNEGCELSDASQEVRQRCCESLIF